ncbi:MAG TPA: response regulator [Methylomirabilota bacterium]|nr:response regulator [Methylomirabilota bacterium]
MKKRILFVDDEPNVLQGLQRMLRPLRDEWDMTFVNSGSEALACLSQTPFDVIVSDMRMPGMDGAQLLTEVMHRHPEVIRIVLSGQANREIVLKAVGPTHQYLAKPCDPESLKALVNQTSALRDLLTDATLKGLVTSMKSLPSLPSLFLEIVDVLKAPDVSIQQVARIIAKDVGMTAKVLQLVNSSFFGLRRRVDDLPRAISLLGFDTIKSLVLSLHVFSQCKQDALHTYALHTLWDHSFAAGACARLIARLEKQAPPVIDAAMTAGMLHDCGKLVLATNLPELYGQALTLAQNQNLPVWEAERITFGATHAEVGAYLLGIWGLPNTTVEALAFHHCPAHSSGKTLSPLTAVHIANALVQEQQAAAVKSSLAAVDFDYLTTLGLADRLPLWREQCIAFLQEGGNQ